MKPSNNANKLLIYEPPLQVLPSLACLIGLNEAIALQQLHYLLQNPKMGTLRDGHKWIEYSYQEWKNDHFKFWSVPTIQRVWLALEKIGLVVAKKYSASAHDQRKSYRIDYDAFDCINLMPSDGIKLTRSERVRLMPSLISNNTQTFDQEDRSSSDPAKSAPPVSEIEQDPTPAPPAPTPAPALAPAGEIASALEQLCGALNGMSLDYINTWIEIHETKYILAAITEAQARGGRSAQYVDKILRRYEQEGYPETIEQRKERAAQTKAQRTTNATTNALALIDQVLQD